jgi:hypothetical protein
MPKVIEPETTILRKQKHGEKAKKKSDDKKRWKKMLILWELPQWKHITVYHIIDLMHVNAYRSLLGTLMNDQWKTKDHAKARADLQDLDIRPKLMSKLYIKLT